ncbi:TIGR03643 family protein [Flavihumibacter sp. UBA7668]|uniref:TIGR03643 family protein n=1 Tax=Flavihumibacter sp. UBA7668 TaxID=1946542 RepID=UPI0025B90A5D|nr:TIGR03643 family protein [Flavihumibacter sp. UBA7668]
MEPIQLTDIDIDRIVEMAWEDRTPFEAILVQFGLTEKEVITLMRRQLLKKSFERWRKRVQSRSTKHKRLRNKEVIRFKCSRQKTITNNKISKRS